MFLIIMSSIALLSIRFGVDLALLYLRTTFFLLTVRACVGFCFLMLSFAKFDSIVIDKWQKFQFKIYI